MLNKETAFLSLRRVYKFTQVCGTPNGFEGKTDVIVKTKGTTYVYSNITVQIRYRNGQDDYFSVNIMWEEDKKQVYYKELGLQGVYSTIFHKFSFSKSLKLRDGKCLISILVPQ